MFDAVLRPRHDGPGGGNALSIVGAVGPVSGDALKTRRGGGGCAFWGRGAAVDWGFVGRGESGVCVFGGGMFADSGSGVLRLREATGGTILATASRRTGAENVRALGEGFLWEDGLGNPYMDILAAADVLLVTGDSVNMLSEACSAGRPVLIFPPVARGGVRGWLAAGKFLAFHADLEERGLARVWREGEGLEGLEDWEAPGLDETARAAEWLAEKIRAARVNVPCAGRGLNPRPESSIPAKCPPVIPNPERHSPEMNPLIPFPSVVALPSRGWIVPVGGSTPDRLQDRLDQLKIGSRPA